MLASMFRLTAAQPVGHVSTHSFDFGPIIYIKLAESTIKSMLIQRQAGE